MTQIQSYPQSYLNTQRYPETNGVKIELINPQQGESCCPCCPPPPTPMGLGAVPQMQPMMMQSSQNPQMAIQMMPPAQAILYAPINAPLLNNFPPKPIPQGVVYNYSHTDIYHGPKCIHLEAPRVPAPPVVTQTPQVPQSPVTIKREIEINKPVFYAPSYSSSFSNIGLPPGHPPIGNQQPNKTLDAPKEILVEQKEQSTLQKKEASVPTNMSIVIPKEVSLPDSSNPVKRIDISPFVNTIKSPNPQEQFEALKAITAMSQDPNVPQDLLLREDVFNNVAEVITKDAKQDDEKAQMNKIYATYTLSAVQKNFRDSVTKQTNKQGMYPVKLNEIPKIDVIINNAKSHPNPMVQQASIETLAFLREPQDKEELDKIYKEAAKSKDTLVQASAQVAMEENNK